jgi:ribosomal protein S18 acetylase RimI-like enzyme
MEQHRVGASRQLKLPTIRVRQAAIEDADECLELYRRVLEEGRWFITDPDEFAGTLAWQCRAIQDFQRRDNGAFFVACRGREIVGVLTLQGGHLRRMAHAAKLEVFVDSSARGLGVGRRLLQTAIDWAEAHPDLRKVGLAVFEDNARALSLYRSFGFEIEGRREGEYREPDGTLRADLLMHRSV